MYYDTQMNNGGLSLSELLSATKRPMETNTGFPYTKEVCKCRFGELLFNMLVLVGTIKLSDQVVQKMIGV